MSSPQKYLARTASAARPTSNPSPPRPPSNWAAPPVRFQKPRTPVARPRPAQDRHRQGHPAFRLHARKRDFVRHPFHGRGRAVHRAVADAGVAYATRSLRADAGIVITASHNPYADNGIKFFRADGYKLDDKIEDKVENLVFSGEIENIRPTADAVGKAVRIDDALGRYIEFAKASFRAA